MDFKKVVYIGIYSSGSTSKMRCDVLKSLNPDSQFEIINTDIPFRTSNRIIRSIGFRYKVGPLVRKINKYVVDRLSDQNYDLIWVDKAIYLTKKTTELLARKTSCLVHFTPDPAFTFHRSKHFYNSIQLYDYLVTTKSFEIDYYRSAKSGNSIILYVTQGFDKKTHRPLHSFLEKKGVVFIGHYEKERGETLQYLLDRGIEVKVAGRGWETFAKSNRGKHGLTYLDNGVYGEKYVEAVSSGLFALGSISKWIPEKHTTRTFEIPACKTALLTEKNEELLSFFDNSEVVYYTDNENLVSKINYYLDHKDELELLIEGGYKKVQIGGYDYESIMEKILSQLCVK